MRKFLLTFLVSLVIAGILQAQTSRLKKADALFEAGGYYEAIDIYKKEIDKIQEDKPLFASYLYKIGTCYRLIGNPRQAEIWYSKAIQREVQEPKVFYYYAEMLKMGEKYDEAIEQFQKYKSLVPGDELADVGLRSCGLAKQWMASPSGYEIVNLRAINTKQSDYSPTYASDDYTVLYFTSSREDATGSKNHAATGEKFADIFMTTRDRKGVWSKPVSIGDAINTSYDEGTPAVSSDGNNLFFTRCRVSKRDKLGCEIWVSEKRSQGWGDPISIPIAADSMIVAHPSISQDGLELYFVSNIASGFGGLDIWKVTRTSTSDSWGEPINLGGSINTPGNEMFPFIHPDGTLYYSSDGLPGIGGLDIFKATQKEGGVWAVENMRFPVNSPADDFGIIFEKEREAGYFSSRRSGGRGADDIYLFYLPPIIYNVIGEVNDEKTKAPIANATVRLVGSDGAVINGETDTRGGFKFILTPNTDYVLVVSKKGYLNGKDKLTTRELKESKDFDSKIKLTSTEKPIELPNIFYDYNRWELRPESMAALDRLVEILNDNPNITIELGSHTDSRGTMEYNYDLSQKRAQSVVNYLIEKGIAAARLKAKGYAQSQPKVADEALAAQYSYVKVGDVLNQAFVDKLATEEQKETIYQVNRRTEFRVLRTDYK